MIHWTIDPIFGSPWLAFGLAFLLLALPWWMGESATVTPRRLTHSIGAGRFGRELYPYLMLILAAFLIAEQAIASRFYQLGTARSSKQA